MPLVKIDFVVSFSSEDPEHPASNLLVSDVKSKWLCNKGESSCSVVLQLKSACKLDTVTIGAYDVALIEVLVGRSEKPLDPFQVLVPSCVLLSPSAARRGAGAESVRTFSAAQLTDARTQRWDRVRLVCSQPYNKHCKYGLGFVHLSGPESPGRSVTPDAARDAGSSDDEFRPGELFARHQRTSLAKLNTDAQIRHASSQALQNNVDTFAALTKTPIARPAADAPPGPSGRARQHNSENKSSLITSEPSDEKSAGTPRNRGVVADVLAGVVLALSGYANPRRAALRAAALQLGAQYRRDWQPDCTHLVCAFPNTPKLRAVRAAKAATVAVAAEWLEQCLAQRRRLPWRWFATEPQQRRAAPALSPAGEPARSPSEADTDDEIEKVLQHQSKKTRLRAASPDVQFVCDERVRAHLSLHSDSDDTEEDERPGAADDMHVTKELPSFWSGATFAVSAGLGERRAALLARYIRAYGGLVLPEAAALEGSGVQYVVGAAGARCGEARRVSPEWVWRAHCTRGRPAEL